MRHTKLTSGRLGSIGESRIWSREAYERDGRLRLPPALGSLPLEKLEVEHVREMMDELVEAMEAGELAAQVASTSLNPAEISKRSYVTQRKF